jgi:hypothetical protein
MKGSCRRRRPRTSAVATLGLQEVQANQSARPASPRAVTVACPPTPGVNCTAPPCPFAGAPVQLVGTCRASDPAAGLLYTVGGQNVQATTCPAANVPLVVNVQPVYLGLPACAYVPVPAYTLTGARGGRAAGGGGRPRIAAPHGCGGWYPRCVGGRFFPPRCRRFMPYD